MNAWYFKNKKTGKRKLYGNLRELAKNELVHLNGLMKTENGVRYLVKDGNKYEDDNFDIEKMKIITSINKV